MTYEEKKALVERFRRDGFVFAVTISSEQLIRMSISCDAEDDSELYKKIIFKQYPIFNSYPKLVKSISFKENRQCVTIDEEFRTLKSVNSRAIYVTLDPSVFEITFDERRIFVNTQWKNISFFANFAAHDATVESIDRHDFVMIDFVGIFWQGSYALSHGYQMMLAPDPETYDEIIRIQSEKLKKFEKK